ncbi:MAG TPA: NADH-quinone oxidoreductase subunit J [Gammaproteobacteria bacterium]
MNVAFYVFAAVAVVAAVMTVTRLNAMHALLYLIVALLALASVFFVFGAPFAALLEVIVYAGAIMVLFVFAVMMLNLGEQAIDQERQWLSGRVWIGPSILCAILLAELVYVLAADASGEPARAVVDAESVAALLFGRYLLAVEIASMLLLAGLVGAYRVGRALEPRDERPAPERAARAARR